MEDKILRLIIVLSMAGLLASIVTGIILLEKKIGSQKMRNIEHFMFGIIFGILIGVYFI